MTTHSRRVGDPCRAASARPVLLTVDDDPSVSRAVARDLRRRYGADYRILRADSGDRRRWRPSGRSCCGASRWPRSWPTTGCRG